MPPQRLQGCGLVRIAPKLIEGLVISAERGPESLDREGADGFRVPKPVPGADRGIGGQGRRARRAPEQGLLFALLEVIASQPGKDVGHGEDLTGSDLAVE